MALKKILHALVYILLVLLDIKHPVAQTQSEREHYVSTILFELKWGEKPEEAGKLDFSGEETVHQCPKAFDVDENGIVYILDSVNGKIKLFDQKGALIQCITVNDTGGDYGTIALDEKRNIWHLNSSGRFIQTYSGDGTLLQTIEYDKRHPIILGFNLTIRDGVIMGDNIDVELTRLSSRKGAKGEPVYTAVLTRTETNRLAIGTQSKRMYSYRDNYTPQGSNVSITGIGITEENGLKHELVFAGMDPMYHVFFVREDIFGNAYFIGYYYQIRKPPQLLKYNSNMEFVTKIDDLPYQPAKHGYYVDKWLVIDSKGTIYVMNMQDTGVKIMKWYVEND